MRFSVFVIRLNGGEYAEKRLTCHEAIAIVAREILFGKARGFRVLDSIKRVWSKEVGCVSRSPARVRKSMALGGSRMVGPPFDELSRTIVR